jgi:hypothetical protein
MNLFEVPKYIIEVVFHNRVEGSRRQPERGGGGGVEWSIIKFFHKNQAYVPRSKPQAKTPERK